MRKLMWGSFDVFCHDFNVTPEERERLAMHLVAIRMHKLLKALLP